MAKKKPDEKLWNLGDKVRIRYHEHHLGKIVELRGPLGPDGIQIYRVRYRKNGKPAYVELTGDHLIPATNEESPAQKKG